MKVPFVQGGGNIPNSKIFPDILESHNETVKGIPKYLGIKKIGPRLPC